MSIEESQEVYRAREQIRALVDEIAGLARSEMSETAFYSTVLERILQAM